MDSPKRMKRSAPPAPLHLKSSNTESFSKLDTSVPKSLTTNLPTPNAFVGYNSCSGLNSKDWDNTYDPALLHPFYSPLADSFDNTTHVVPQTFQSIDEPLTSPLYLSKSSSSGSHSPSMDSESQVYSIQRAFTPEDSAGETYPAHHSMMPGTETTWQSFMEADIAYPAQALGPSPILVSGSDELYNHSHHRSHSSTTPEAVGHQPTVLPQPMPWESSFDSLSTSFFAGNQFPLPGSSALRSSPTHNSRTTLSQRGSRGSKTDRRRPRRTPYSPSATSKALTPSASSGSSNWECVDCNTPFRDLASLQKHVKAEHTRPLVCVFHWAGCTSRFASKNEWKRHVFSQHLALKYWLCTEGACGEAKATSSARSRRSVSLPSVGCIFNRKDLYTQHVRRMHVNPESARSKKANGTDGRKDASAPNADDYIRQLQEQASRTRCELPTYMICPAPNCNMEFHGREAWDERMEHVAGHLDRAAVGEEPPVTFGGLEDWTLTSWAEKEGVEVVKRTATGWRLCSPLRGDGSNRARKGSSSVPYSEDEDAEGEECSPHSSQPWMVSAAGSAKKRMR